MARPSAIAPAKVEIREGEMEEEQEEMESTPTSPRGRKPPKGAKGRKAGKKGCTDCEGCGGTCGGAMKKRRDSIYAAGFQMDAAELGTSLTPSPIRQDLKCGKGSISQGEKCSKGAASRAQQKEPSIRSGMATGAKWGAGIGAGLGAVQGAALGGMTGGPVGALGGAALGAAGGAIGTGITGAVIGGGINAVRKAEARGKKKEQPSQATLLRRAKSAKKGLEKQGGLVYYKSYDSVYADGFGQDSIEVADVMDPYAIRSDLKCGKGSISQGEKCTKGAASRANASEKATMALGIAGAAASTAGVIHSLNKGNMVNFERSLAGVSGSVAVAGAGKAAYEKRMGHEKQAQAMATASAFNAGLAGFAAYRAGGEARQRNAGVKRVIERAKYAKAKSNDYLVSSLKSAKNASESARRWAAEGKTELANFTMASAMGSVQQARATRAAGRSEVRSAISELKKRAPYSPARRRRAMKQGESPLTAYLNY